MSLDAMIWAVKDAPVADVQEHAVLSVMADEGDEAGCASFLSVPTIAERSKLSEREVRACQKAMLERGLIGYGNQTLAAYIRKDRRPVVYDLLIPVEYYGSSLARVNRERARKGLEPLTGEACGDQACKDRPATATGQRCPHRPPIAPAPPKKRRSDWVDPATKAAKAAKAAKKAPANGVTTSPPADPADEVTGSPAVDLGHGVTNSPGGLQGPDGVTTRSPRGDYQSPNPVINPALNPEDQNPSSTTSVTRKAANEPTNATEAEAEVDLSSKAEDQNPETVDDLVDLAVELVPHFLPSQVRRALLHSDVVARPKAVIAEALRCMAAGMFGTTHHPNRLHAEGFPWVKVYARVPKELGGTMTDGGGVPEQRSPSEATATQDREELERAKRALIKACGMCGEDGRRPIVTVEFGKPKERVGICTHQPDPAMAGAA